MTGWNFFFVNRTGASLVDNTEIEFNFLVIG